MIDEITTMNTHTITTSTYTVPVIPPTLTVSWDDASKPQLVSPMENVDILRLVVSFIGPKNYQFIAVISKNFHAAYQQEFPMDSTTTKLNASTIEFAKICWEELKHPLPRQQYRLTDSAARFGSLPAMQYLRSVGCRWDQWTCSNAAQNGHLHILQYAREKGCPWNEWTCAYAASNGHLHILQWLRENGCPWDKYTCTFAANNGYLHILQYARKNGCPWDKCTCTSAARNGHLHILQWARENGCPEH